MSVINQMLKGLDKESQQQQAAIERSGAVIVAAPKNDNKVAIALITSMVAVAALAAYLFMQKESKVEQQAVTQQQIVQARVAESAAEPELVAKPAIAKLNVDNATVTAPKVTVPVVTAPIVTAPIVTESVAAQSVAVKSIAVQPITIQAPKVQQAAVRAPAKQVSAKNTQVVREVKPIAHDIVHDITDETVTEVADSVSIKAVTRTPTQQAGLYAKQAESALLAGDKIRAKELFVKVLAFDKQHDLAREKLAAILYGEQRTQSAVKLLQEGLSISPQYTNFRLMLARIYLKNNNKPQAYYYLKPHQPAVAGHVDYYAILAGLAQNLDDLDTALVAYKKLTVHEPNRAKWWLGLGITADKAQHVDLALNAYHTAQNMGQLSASSRNYINARITQLEKQ
ncbi:tetratricopeptide repeat protein [Moritella marina ATCC 15381]|uniref:Tetratricopeptide repeat protein n=1 Tax=Moritella marina ATCC 15381 TaxID=1202962 RepID=A0A5J6WNK0_MORMI|nr:tetratricopeptide repeat protein [Moritella marina]QFI39736.1 tetratricopeptide repeat protein [Moritella marina ATCC 15381]